MWLCGRRWPLWAPRPAGLCGVPSGLSLYGRAKTPCGGKVTVAQLARAGKPSREGKAPIGLRAALPPGKEEGAMWLCGRRWPWGTEHRARLPRSARTPLCPTRAVPPTYTRVQRCTSRGEGEDRRPSPRSERLGPQFVVLLLPASSCCRLCRASSCPSAAYQSTPVSAGFSPQGSAQVGGKAEGGLLHSPTLGCKVRALVRQP